QAVADFVGEGLEASGVVLGGVEVMDRAGADHHENTRVGAVENGLYGLSALDHGLRGLLGHGDFPLERHGRDQRFLGLDVEVFKQALNHDLGGSCSLRPRVGIRVPAALNGVILLYGGGKWRTAAPMPAIATVNRNSFHSAVESMESRGRRARRRRGARPSLAGSGRAAPGSGWSAPRQSSPGVGPGPGPRSCNR